MELRDYQRAPTGAGNELTGAWTVTLLEQEVQRGYGRGWSYTPLGDKKNPILKGWQKRQRASLDESLAWARRDKRVGIRMGAASGVMIVDLDPGAPAELVQLLPPTVVAITGRGGRHLYYRAATGSKLKNWVGELGPHIDIRTDGGQALSVGSVHPNGELYRWSDGESPDDREFAECPQELLADMYERHQEVKRAAKEKQRAATPKKRVTVAATSNGRGAISRYAAAAFAAELDRVRDATKNHRNATLNRAAFSLGQLVGGGKLCEHEVEAALFETASKWIGDECNETEIRKTIDSGLSAGKREPRMTPPRENGGEIRSTGSNGHQRTAVAPAPPLTDAKPVQQKVQGYVLTPGAHTTDTGDYLEVGTDRFTQAVLSRIASDRLYRMGDVPGEIIGRRGKRKFRLMTGVKMRIVVDEHMRLGKWIIKKSGGGGEPVLVFVACSPDHGELVLEQAGTNESIRELHMLVNHPVVLRDFTVSAPEWNENGVFYDQPPALAGVRPETDTEVIRHVLSDLVVDFPFKDEPSRQNFFGLLLTPILRHALDANAPMHLVMAPLERTGKTKLVEQVLGGIILGSKTPALQMSGTEEERDKRILSILLRGDTVTHIDNIRDEVDSAVLASLLTATTYSSRLLGASKMVDVPNNLIVVGSGNNITATGEITKRSIPILLQPADDQPEERHDFQHPDLPTYVAAVREEVLSVLLGMIAIWNGNGRPQGHLTLGGFERWSQAVGGILLLCGYEEWMNNYGTWVNSADTTTADLRAFVAAWANGNDKPKQASALMNLANELALFPECFISPSIRGQQTSFAMRVLTRNVDRPVGEWMIRRTGSGNGALYYLSKNRRASNN